MFKSYIIENIENYNIIDINFYLVIFDNLRDYMALNNYIEENYIKIAGKLGQSKIKIAAKHMVPHVFPQFLVGLILLFPHAILHEAAITFLGFGLPPEQPGIGIILSESMKYLSLGMWWLALFPGLALLGTVLLFDLAGGSLRKLIDPHSAQD